MFQVHPNFEKSSAELSEAINSMWSWYRNSAVCFAYVEDWGSSKKPEWFTRGWTLQELIAPAEVLFFDKQRRLVGNRFSLSSLLRDCTGIDVELLSGERELKSYCVAQRLSWAAQRKTSRAEDSAYCLMVCNLFCSPCAWRY